MGWLLLFSEPADQALKALACGRRALSNGCASPLFVESQQRANFVTPCRDRLKVVRIFQHPNRGVRKKEQSYPTGYQGDFAASPTGGASIYARGWASS